MKKKKKKKNKKHTLRDFAKYKYGKNWKKVVPYF